MPLPAECGLEALRVLHSGRFGKGSVFTRSEYNSMYPINLQNTFDYRYILSILSAKISSSSEIKFYKFSL
jgi:hypothetical protein